MSFRSRLRAVKYSTAPLIERAWRPVIARLARARRVAPARWSSPGGQRVAVVAPHPDDEAIGCVGALLSHVRAGDDVSVVIATDGRRSGALPDAGAMARQRHDEAATAARLLGVARLEWLGLPEGAWRHDALVEALHARLVALRPEVVYAPSRVDFHPEHRAVAHALAVALEAAGSAAQLRVYQVQVPLGAALTNLVADASALRAECTAVLEAYGSQVYAVACAYRLRRYAAAAQGSAGWLEPYWQVSAARYAALHRIPPAQWPAVFRGLRAFPLSDPLAWIAGGAERRRLAASG